jgi:signal transduction histidine kinase/ligand-binding sensor domain-containing protein/DNA-binding response OmpR family regulator
VGICRALKSYLTFLLLFGFCIPVWSQSLIFEHLSVREGLSQFTVHDFYQDEFGQMWIATADGLNRYDGKTIESFRPQAGDTTGLFGSNILAVTGNGKGNLYIQCLSGLLKYNLKTQKFTTLLKRGVSTLTYAEGRLWLGSGPILNYYDEATGKIKEQMRFSADVQIRTLLYGVDGSLYIGTSKGLYQLDQNGKLRLLIQEIYTVCLYQDRDKSVWVGTLEDGLFRINSRTGVSQFKHLSSDPTSVSDNFIRSICQDDLGGFWVGTFKGLDFFDAETRVFKNFKHSPVERQSLSDLSVWCIEKDAQGSLWIGTYFGGVNIFNPEFSFSRFYRPTGQNTGPNSAIMGRATEDSKGNLWICTDYGGLNFFDAQMNTFSYYKSQAGDPSTLSSNTLKDIYFDPVSQILWIGSHLGGLDRLDTRTGRISRVDLKTGNRSIDKYVRRIVPYKGKLLLGTHDGIQIFDPQTHSVEALLPLEAPWARGQVWDMLVDREGVLWFSIRGEVARHHLEENRTLPALPELQVHNVVFFEDSKGQVWAGGAGKGLFRSNGSQWEWYSTLNSGLADDYILDIEESETGYILISTNKGLSRYNPSDRTFYNYNNHQFFPFEALNEKSIYVKRSGEIVLSSLSGLMVLKEKDLLYPPKPHAIIFTALRLNNQTELPGGGVLDEAISGLSKINISERHSMLQIDFAVTNYIKALNPQVEYMLEGFEDKWLPVPSNYSLSFTNLRSGQYSLKLRSLYGGKVMAHAQLELQVNPPFYKTWIAYLFYLAVLLGILYLLYSQVRLKDSLKNADIQARHAEEVNQSKLRFFMNVSHEIRTPVTLIMAQLDMLLSSSTQLSPQLSGRLQNIRKNATNLKKLISELLDFKKQEEGLVKLQLSEQDLVKYLHTIFVSFQDYANSLSVHVSFYSSEEKILMDFDRRQLEKVIYNLFSNAFKFTPPGGTVRMQVGIHDGQAEITVSDTGIGISEVSINQIFNRFYQAEDTAVQPMDPGTGLGLSLVKDIVEQHQGSVTVSSQLSKGTTFRILLPIKSRSNASGREGSSGQEDKKMHTVLVVEDNLELQGVLVELFSPMYNVVAISDGNEAFDAAKRILPDLVLLDLMLPNVSGMEICKRIKSDLKTKHIPVVLLTAAASAEKKIEGLQLGADDYITKPFEARELIIRCNSLVNSRQALKVEAGKEKVYSSNVAHQNFIKEAGAIVLNNLDNAAFSVDQFAELLNVSRSTLFTKMKEITGQTPNEFILEIRLKKSLELLKGDDAVSQVAFSVGFNDPSYFIKQFRKYFGITPGQHRSGKKALRQ